MLEKIKEMFEKFVEELKKKKKHNQQLVEQENSLDSESEVEGDNTPITCLEFLLLESAESSNKDLPTLKAPNNSPYTLTLSKSNEVPRTIEPEAEILGEINIEES